ncbi:hypothetical protein [Anaplasma phagocytophilum]|nr:hypothetical protein [Anaplasma phagocytophilum]
MHGLGNEPVCKGVIAGLQGGNVSYFDALKVLMRVLSESAGSVERAQGIGEQNPDGTSLNGERVLLAILSLYEAEGLVAGAIGDAEWDATRKEEIASQFFKKEGKVLIHKCLQALHDLGQTRFDVKPLKESDTDIICHVSNAVVALADAMALVRSAHTLASRNVVAEDSQPIKETKRRIHRCIDASRSAVCAMRVPILQASIDQLREGGSGEKIQKMMLCLLREVAALSELIYDSEEEEFRKSVSGTAYVADDLLLSCAALPVLDCSTTAFCASVVRAAMNCAYDEHKRNAEGTHQCDDEVGESYCLSMMLIEAAATACDLDYSMSAVPEATSSIEQCKTAIHNLVEKVGAALAAVCGRNLDEIKSLGDANASSYITGLVAGAQQLLESIDVDTLPDPVRHGELLHRTREILIDAGSLCIRLQCAGDPEYSVPAECDCQNPQEWDFPSTSMEAASPSSVVYSRGYASYSR